MTLKKRIEKLESIFTETIGEVMLLSQTKEGLFKQYDYSFNESEIIYTHKEMQELSKRNNIAFITIIERGRQ